LGFKSFFNITLNKMIKNIQLVLLIGIFLISFSCIKDIEDDEQYRRPDWLEGKVYTQIEAQPELSTFAKCIKLIGFDSVINVSGSYTVFAPDNDAFALYLQNHNEYNSVEDIPKEELLRLIKSHVIRDPWSVEQLRQLDVNGWIDTTDETNNKPKGFKRETLLRDRDLIYGVIQDDLNKYRIVDTLSSTWYRRHATDGNKYASIFFKEYLDIYGLKADDYLFYFGRSFENPQDIYYMDGKIIKKNIFAENGFIHIIDRVTEPLQNAYEILNTKTESISYSKFLDLINTFPSFFYNRDKTNAQPGAKLGYQVDSLFDITYPSLAFTILNEQTLAPSGATNITGNPTVRYHNGLVAPTNEAFDAFVNEYLVGSGKWGSIQNAPDFIRRMIVNTHMSISPIYPTYNNQNGFYNGEKDYVKIDLSESNIVHKQYGSNCSFIGVNNAIVPRAFSCVAGPIYLNRGYSYVMYAIERSGLLTALKEEGHNYSFFVESDENCRIDSSFIYGSELIGGQLVSSFSAYQKQGGSWKKNTLTISDLRNHLLNHIGTDVPKGIARKEFIKNLAGNYIIINNETGEYSGTAATMIGYLGSDSAHVINPPLISTNSYNGKTYAITNWFSFSSNSMFVKISTDTELSKFYSLLIKAGLVSNPNTLNAKFNFLSESEFYTVFAPTNNAFNDYNADTLSIDLLKQVLKTHFIQGAFIFTDGKTSSNYYETVRVDEKSTPYTTVFSKIYIEPGIDVINFQDKLGGSYLTVSESLATNYITGKLVTESTIKEQVSTGVIHKIDKVLLYKDLDSQ
jgi:uncharacterized surface protein with fasciclin (FAS1) repeats